MSFEHKQAFRPVLPVWLQVLHVIAAKSTIKLLGFEIVASLMQRCIQGC